MVIHWQLLKTGNQEYNNELFITTNPPHRGGFFCATLIQSDKYSSQSTDRTNTNSPMLHRNKTVQGYRARFLPITQLLQLLQTLRGLFQ